MKKFLRAVLIFILIVAVASLVAACTDDNREPNGSGNGGNNVQTGEQTCKHEFAEYTVTDEPTETRLGYAEGECILCGEKSGFYLPMLSEENYSLEIIPATCTEDGKKIYTSAYGTFEVEIPATEHNYKPTVVKEPSCTEKGLTEYECTLCGDKYSEESEKVEHNYVVTDYEEATCTYKGYTKYACSMCGDEVVVEGSEFAHKYGDGVHVSAVCPDYGYTEFVCSECGDVKTVYETELVHVYDSVSGKCEFCGKTCEYDFEGYKCPVCGLDIEERVAEDGFYHLDGNRDGIIGEGEIVYFGFYPCTVVTDNSVIKQLAETQPSDDGYYELNGVKYIKKALDQRYSGLGKFSDGTVINSKVFSSGYYYRVEPVEWTVEETTDGKVLLRSKYAVDVLNYLDKESFYFDAEKGGYYVNGEENYACEWETSDLREFLNVYFLTKAFNDIQRELIVPVVNDNGPETNYYQGKAHADCEDTTDFIFVDAYSDLFGEDEAASDASEERTVKATDYAIGSGIGLKNGYATGKVEYYTRSAGLNSNNIGIINTEGAFSVSGQLYSEKDETGTVDGKGAVPCLWISVNRD